jgi:diguanylate cyclase (GGDEF)-like protein
MPVTMERLATPGDRVRRRAAPVGMAGAGASPQDSMLATRQSFLDALPIAAAIITRSKNSLIVQGRNAIWARFDADAADGLLLARLEHSETLAQVIDGMVPDARFDWRDGGLVDGRYFTVSVSPLRPGTAGAPRVLVTLIDRTAEIQAERSLQGEKLNDALTGLPNRAGFVERLEQQMTDDGPDNYSVVAVDLLRFARVNECVGSLGGDELIMTVARRLISTLRGHDLLARTGANEFAMVVRLIDGPGDVLHVARRIEAVLERPCKLSAFEIKVDCAVGCALATDSDGDAETLMRHAQVALKHAKLSRRTELYQPNGLAVARRRFSLETDLRRAIETGTLDMAYQPLMSMSSGRITGFEALARWHHPDRGTVPPAEFIEVAEDSGLIVPLGRWALDRALKTLTEWDAAAGRALPLYMGVNLSAIQVARDDIAGLVARSLKTHRLSGYRLSVELTESALVNDADRAGRTLDALKSVDAMVAMDDFGTGFSNLANLQKLPIDTLKIDRSFITGMLGDPDKVAIVRAILGLAQALGMTTTAEGIETHDLAQTLAALGCTTGQGYLYAPALPSAAALTFALNALN